MGLKTLTGDHFDGGVFKGRGATLNPEGRFESRSREVFDDGWEGEVEPTATPRTFVTEETARSILSENDSPDVPFEVSLNPYRGCEHGCIYCYARPSHAYLDLSPGLDFETRLFAKTNAAVLLREALQRPGYRCRPIAIGANTDPYQPIERRLRITRQVIEVLAACDHPFTIVTKNAMVERDLDLLAPLAARNLVQVFISCATLDAEVARHLEPRASAPTRRLETVRRLAAAGVPCGVLVAPVVPFLTDAGIEGVIAQAAAAGAFTAGFVLLRLPYEIKDLFKDWLAQHFPLKAAHVMSRLRAMRDGRENDARFGSRTRGTGEFAELLAARFALACRRHGLASARKSLDATQFKPSALSAQLSLF